METVLVTKNSIPVWSLQSIVSSLNLWNPRVFPRRSMANVPGCVDIAVLFAYDLVPPKVDFVCVMKASNLKSFANMRRSGLKESAHDESRYIPGSIMVQLMRDI
jgi:hypothetical protein